MKKLILISHILLVCLTASAQRLIESQKLVNSDRQVSDAYGCDVAIDGNHAIVGAFTEYDVATFPSVNTNAGAVYMLEKNSSGTWVETQKLMASDRRANSYFGHSVDIFENYAVVGAPENGWNQFQNMFGKVYIFKRDANGVWNEIQIIYSPITSTVRFGWDVAIDDSSIIVGCPESNYDSSGVNIAYSGTVFFYKLNANGVWQSNGQFDASRPQHYGNFGRSVDIKGTTAIVGHAGDNFDELDSNALKDAGSVQFFKQDSSGSWSYAQKIVASNRQLDSDYGFKVAMDDNVVAIGAPRYSGTYAEQGAVYILEQDTAGEWREVKNIVHLNSPYGSYLGMYLDVKGRHLVAGAFEDEFNNIRYGVAYYYRLDSTSGVWGKIKSYIGSDSERGDQFGGGIAVDEKSVFIGSQLHELDVNGQNRMPFAGAVYSYTFGCPNDTFKLERRGNYLVAPTSGDGDYFWFRCDSANVVLGQSIDSIMIDTNGFYRAVLVYSDGCADSSDCFFVGDVGINEQNNWGTISVFPNPSSGVISISGMEATSYVAVHDLHGRVIRKAKSSGSFSLEGVRPGIYFMTIEKEGNRQVLKIIVK